MEEPVLAITVRIPDLELERLGLTKPMPEAEVEALLRRSGYVTDSDGAFVGTLEAWYDPVTSMQVYRQTLLPGPPSPAGGHTQTG